MTTNATTRRRRLRALSLPVLASVLFACRGDAPPASGAGVTFADLAATRSAKADLARLAAALELHRTDHGAYPTSEEGLSALTRSTFRGAPSSIPDDPWGNPYVYASDGTEFVLMSLGRDGVLGGDGYDRDLTIDSDAAPS